MKAFSFVGKRPKAPAVLANTHTSDVSALTSRAQPVHFDFGSNNDDEAVTPAQAAAINITGRNPTRKRALVETLAFQAPLAPPVKAPTPTPCDVQVLPDGDEVPAGTAAQLSTAPVLRPTATGVSDAASFCEADCNTRQNTAAHLETLQHTTELQHTTTPRLPAARSCEEGGGVDNAVFGVFTVRTTSDGCVYTLKGRRSGDATRAGNGSHSALQHAETHCTAPQSTPTRCTAIKANAAGESILQHATTHCNALQRTVMHSNTKGTCAEEFKTKSERTKEFKTKSEKTREFKTQSERTKEFKSKNGMGYKMQLKPHVPCPGVYTLQANPHAHGHTHQHTHTRTHTHTDAPATQNQPGAHSQKSALGQLYCIT